jgi:hypothetical protein
LNTKEKSKRNTDKQRRKRNSGHNKLQTAQTRKPTSTAPSTSRQEDGTTAADAAHKKKGGYEPKQGTQTNKHLFLTHKERDTLRQFPTDIPQKQTRGTPKTLSNHISPRKYYNYIFTNNVIQILLFQYVI